MATKTQQGIPFIGPLLNKLIGTRNDRFVKKYTSRAAAINAMEPAMRALTDLELRGKFLELRGRHDQGATADDLLADAFAVAREAMDRSVGIRSIFNPRHAFDPSVLPPAARDLFLQTKAAMDAGEPSAPTGAFRGCTEPLPAWMTLDIPNDLYEAVRLLYPESRPPFRSRPFDVQLIGAMVLYGGKIAEMRTGEGKTIVAPLASYLAAVQRLQVHVVTVNDYLVQRDRDWTFPYFRALGLTVGAIHPMHMQPESAKRDMYKCDVVYGTTAEFGFDYLRDNMKGRAEEQVQSKRQFAIVDEVDSILIDEARTPLIISGPAHQDQPRYDLADRLARHLVAKQLPWAESDETVQKCRMRIKGLEGDIRQARDKEKIPALQRDLAAAKVELPVLEKARGKHVQYFEVELDRKACHLTHDGVAEAQREAKVGSFYVGENMDLPHLLEQSLRAHVVYQLDRDYVIMDVPDQMAGRPTPGIVIVDVFTGRPMIGRQWSDGLHQAIESKEKVPIKQETQTVATITIQNYFKMYKRLAGMTGTADTEAQEFHDIYKLDVVSIPTNRHVRRRDFDDLVFLSAKDKWSKIVDEIKEFHDVGRPILVGTTSVEKSETLAQMLTRKHGVKHEVLNAKQHEREAHIIERAGQLGAVMIATNMAGRGTDIKLGQFTREQLLDHWLRRGICPASVTVDSTEEQLREGVYRKIAPQYLEGVHKRDAEQMPFAELEMKLLRHWATTHTWLSDGRVEKGSAEELRLELDKTGRFLLHRLRWFTGIEDIGGLHVIGSERHEARRIDNQLRGRSGRQGDQGSSRFFVSLDDELMKLFAGETTMRVLSRLGMKEGDAIEHPMLSKSVERAQRKVEERNFQVRKNLLEYDEVMEHQRQRFYGVRQRVLEGRNVKGLLLDYIRASVSDATGEYLAPQYGAQCAAEYARQRIDCQVHADRMKGRDAAEMIQAIRADALADTRAGIDVTIGEYLPDERAEASGDAVVDFDPEGLSRWAKTRFGVDIDPEQIRAGGNAGREKIEEMLLSAADEKILSTDLSGVAEFVEPDYGAKQLSAWAKNKFLIEVASDEISKAVENEARPPVTILMEKAEEVYRKREVEYPVEFQMDLTMLLMRQSPPQAAEHLATWASRRFRLPWTPETVKSTPPNKIRDQLVESSEKFVRESAVEKTVADAQACTTDPQLEAYFQERFGLPLPETMRFLEGEERRDAIRSRVESVLRAELLHLERTILISTFDECWKDHLYAMDQLRDSIGFRAFSQQDPRIEYKREGSRMFSGVLENIRDRVTDVVFKARLTPTPPPAPRPAAPAALAAPAEAPALTPGAKPAAPAPITRPKGNFGSSIAGLGFDAPPQPPSKEV